VKPATSTPPSSPVIYAQHTHRETIRHLELLRCVEGFNVSHKKIRRIKLPAAEARRPAGGACLTRRRGGGAAAAGGGAALCRTE
jgi:hypothetical protein